MEAKVIFEKALTVGQQSVYSDYLRVSVPVNMPNNNNSNSTHTTLTNSIRFLNDPATTPTISRTLSKQNFLTVKVSRMLNLSGRFDKYVPAGTSITVSIPVTSLDPSKMELVW